MRDNEYGSIVISSRIRLARNLAKELFPTRLSKEKGMQVRNKIISAVEPIDNFKIYPMNVLAETDAMVMHEKHLISHNLVENKDTGAVCVNQDESISIMINEEDHIRAQCLMKGLSLEKAFDAINKIDNTLASKLNFAFDKKWGYLTSCITNVGTGMRASVMLFLPALTLSGQMEDIINNSLKPKRLTARGVFGEGSGAEGYVYQISNSTSLGNSEREIISLVKENVIRLCELEIEARKRLVKEKLSTARDIVQRSWGILTNCYRLNYEDLLKYLGQLKLGIAIGLIRFKDNYIIDRLTQTCLPYYLSKTFNLSLGEEDLEIYRAEYVSQELKRERIK